MVYISPVFQQRTGGLNSTGRGTPAQIKKIARRFGVDATELLNEIKALSTGNRQHFSTEEMEQIAISLRDNRPLELTGIPSEATHRRKKTRV